MDTIEVLSDAVREFVKVHGRLPTTADAREIALAFLPHAEVYLMGLEDGARDAAIVARH
jgi:hypothetical protein